MFVFVKGDIKTVHRIADVVGKFAGTERPYIANSERGERKGSRRAEVSVRPNIWAYTVGAFSGDDDNVLHPAKFPESLAHDHIISWSDPGDLVYGPFSGSGTTAKMSYLADRKYIGSEISQAYCVDSEQRLERAKGAVIPVTVAVGDSKIKMKGFDFLLQKKHLHE